MAKEKSMGINAVLNAIKSSLSIFFPLISYPYVLRVLGTAGIGKVSYVTSIVGYFTLIAMLGVSTYGVREGAKIKESKEQLSLFVSEVFTINMVATIISYILMFVMIAAFEQLRSYFLLFCIIGLSIVSQTLAVDWINTIFEDFFYITIRSIIIYVVQLLLIFLLIKNSGDYYIYAFLHVLSPIVICFTNWQYCKKYVNIRFVLSPDIKRHLKPLFVLFANTVAVSIYVNFDTTMLGAFKGDECVGLYTASTKVYSVIKSVLIAVYTVVIPRLALLHGKGAIEDFRKLFSDLWNTMTILLLPIGIGLCGVSEDIIMLLGGDAYSGSILSLRILALACIAAIYGGLITSCLNVVIGKENINLIATIIASVINGGLNLLFIPLFAQNGAALTTLIAELFVAIYCFARIENKANYFDSYSIRTNTKQVLVGCIPMILMLMVIYRFMSQSTVRLFVAVLVCAASYGGVLLLMKNAYLIGLLKRIRFK